MTKILRTLPFSFDVLAMTSSPGSNKFDKIVHAVAANVEHRIKIGNLHTNNINQTANLAVSPPSYRLKPFSSSWGSLKGRNWGRFRPSRGKGSLIDSRSCHNCEKQAHFLKMCRTRIADELVGRDNKTEYLFIATISTISMGCSTSKEASWKWFQSWEQISKHGHSTVFPTT